MGEDKIIDQLKTVISRLEQEKDDKQRQMVKLQHEIECITPILWKLQNIVDSEKEANKKN